MKELAQKIREEIATFTENFEKNVESGNKAAGQRARKSSNALAALLKEYRKLSVEEAKK